MRTLPPILMLVLVGCTAPPPALSPEPSKIDPPVVIHFARPDIFSGGGVPFRPNMNGVDVGTLTNGSYCAFYSDDSYLSFSVDEEITALVWFTLIIPPLGIPNVILKSADRYLPLTPRIYPEARTPQFLMLDGAQIVSMSEPDWMSRVRELEEVHCR